MTVDMEKMLIVDVNDGSVTAATVRDELQHRYPDAKVSMLREGGDFPFLSSAAELTLHLEVHLRRCGLFPLREETAVVCDNPTGEGGSSSSGSSSSSALKYNGSSPLKNNSPTFAAGGEIFDRGAGGGRSSGGSVSPGRFGGSGGDNHDNWLADGPINSGGGGGDINRTSQSPPLKPKPKVRYHNPFDDDF